MSIRDNQSLRTRGFDWLGIARILILQILVLLGLTAAGVRYVAHAQFGDLLRRHVGVHPHLHLV